MKPCTRPAIVALLAALAFGAPSVARADGDAGYETAPSAAAADVLRPEVLSGPHHKVRPTVAAEDFLYRFEMESDYGMFAVTGRRMAVIRAKEIETIAALLAMDPSGEFTKALSGRLSALPGAAVDLVKDPVGSVEAMGKGVERTLGRVGGLFGSRKSTAYEGSGTDEALFGADKRKLAYELDVDPYSTNPKLQTMLTEVARARRAGTFGVDVGGMFVPGGAGIALSVVKMRDDVKGLLRDNTPAELDAINEGKLAKRGVARYLRRDFAAHRWLSPTHRTAIAEAVDRLDGVEDVGTVVAASLTAQDEPRAVLQTQQAAFLAWHHATVERLASLDLVGSLAVAFTASGKLVLCAPIDVVPWTESIERTAKAVRALPGADAAASRDLYWTGKATPRAAKELAALGFTLHEGFSPK